MTKKKKELKREVMIKMRNKIYTTGIFLIILIVIVAGFFLLGRDTTQFNLTVLGYLVVSTIWSYLVVLAIVSKSKGEHTFFKLGLSTTTGFFILATAIYSNFAGAFDEDTGKFLLGGVIICAIYGIFIIAIVAASGFIHKANQKALLKKESKEYDKPQISHFSAHHVGQNS
jgi:hypothetical protein